MTRLLFLIILGLTCSLFNTWGQAPSDTTGKIKVPAIVENGDTIVIATLGDIDIYADTISKPQVTFSSKREERKYNRLVRDVKKVYPWAKMAKAKLDEMNNQFVLLKSEKERKEFTKKVEKEIMDNFAEELKSYTIPQGRLLLKLIDRETGNTSYELLKDLRGGVSAFFWQAVARLFGNNLKSKYDPNGEDKNVEEIIRAIDAGLI